MIWLEGDCKNTIDYRMNRSSNASWEATQYLDENFPISAWFMFHVFQENVVNLLIVIL